MNQESTTPNSPNTESSPKDAESKVSTQTEAEKAPPSPKATEPSKPSKAPTPPKESNGLIEGFTPLQSISPDTGAVVPFGKDARVVKACRYSHTEERFQGEVYLYLYSQGGYDEGAQHAQINAMVGEIVKQMRGKTADGRPINDGLLKGLPPFSNKRRIRVRIVVE